MDSCRTAGPAVDNTSKSAVPRKEDGHAPSATSYAVNASMTRADANTAVATTVLVSLYSEGLMCVGGEEGGGECDAAA